MTDAKRFYFAAFSLVITLSSVTMLWLLWRFPIPTCTGSIVLLGCLLHCIRVARLIDLVVGLDLVSVSAPVIRRTTASPSPYRWPATRERGSETAGSAKPESREDRFPCLHCRSVVHKTSDADASDRSNRRDSYPATSCRTSLPSPMPEPPFLRPPV